MKPITTYLPTAARIIMGLLFIMTGSNGFLNFLPQPAPDAMPAAAMAFAGALMQTGFLFPLIMGIQLVVGILLVANRFVPLALAVIAPIVVGIIGFHLFLAPSGAAMGILALILEVYLAWTYRDVYRPMLAMKVMPKPTRK